MTDSSTASGSLPQLWQRAVQVVALWGLAGSWKKSDQQFFSMGKHKTWSSYGHRLHGLRMEKAWKNHLDEQGPQQKHGPRPASSWSICHPHLHGRKP